MQNELQRVVQLGDEVNAERLALSQDNWMLKATLANKDRELDALKNIEKPDYEFIRDSEALRRSADRILRNLKMGQQSAAGKAINLFIKELKS